MVEKRSKHETVVTLRLPKDLHEKLKQEGGERGLTAEIRRRLEASFTSAPVDVPAFRDVLAAINKAGKIAAQPHPEGWPDRYAIFEAALRALLRAYRPDGVEPLTSETAWQAFATATAAVVLHDSTSPAFHRLIELQRTGEQP